MRFWFEDPDQWVYVEKERYHQHPWSVVIGLFVRARYTTKREADECARQLKAAFRAAKGNAPVRRRHSRSGQIRCPICEPFRCKEA